MYESTKVFWDAINGWADPELAAAPAELAGGFVSVSSLAFPELSHPPGLWLASLAALAALAARLSGEAKVTPHAS